MEKSDNFPLAILSKTSLVKSVAGREAIQKQCCGRFVAASSIMQREELIFLNHAARRFGRENCFLRMNHKAPSCQNSADSIQRGRELCPEKYSLSKTDCEEFDHLTQ